MSEKSVFLRECYERLHDDLRQLDEFVQNITKNAYRNVYLISNPVLSRSPFNSKLFHNFNFRIAARLPSNYELIWKLIKYYLKSLIYLANHVATWMVVRIFFRYTFKCVDNPVIIDNFLLVEPTLTNQSYEEKYFPGLQEVLLRHAKDVYIFPSIYGGVSLFSNCLQLFRIIRNSPVSIITEYDLLKAADFLSLARFICFYPFAVIRLSQQIDNSCYLGKLLSSELLETLDQVTAYSYIRYLTGKRLRYLFKSEITVISWFENQTQQKNFFRSLRDTSQNSSIYACRAYIDYPAYLNSFVAEAEVLCGVTPDKVLVNGTAYMKRSDNLEYRLGVSFRYKYLFNPTAGLVDHKTQSLLFLSYFYERNKEFLNLCSASVLTHQTVKVRTHPADTRSSDLILPAKWAFDVSDKCSVFNNVAIIITSESGIAVEAAALGVSVIVVANQSSFTCNPMFDYGRGVIWDIVFDSVELDSVYKLLMEQRLTNIEEITKIAEWYKSSCFVEPSEDNISRAFDLT
jgi:hypothetical protein